LTFPTPMATAQTITLPSQVAVAGGWLLHCRGFLEVTDQISQPSMEVKGCPHDDHSAMQTDAAHFGPGHGERAMGGAGPRPRPRSQPPGGESEDPAVSNVGQTGREQSRTEEEQQQDMEDPIGSWKRVATRSGERQGPHDG